MAWGVTVAATLTDDRCCEQNYTCLHVREGYADMGRRSWRVWMWAEGACYGGPDWIRDANGRRDKAFAKVVWA